MAVSRLLSHLATRTKTDRMWLRSWYLFPTDLIPFGKTNGCFSDAPDVIFASLNWQHNSLKNGYRKNVIRRHQKPNKWKRCGFHCNLPWGDWCGHYGTTFAPLEFLKITPLERRLKHRHRLYNVAVSRLLSHLATRPKTDWMGIRSCDTFFQLTWSRLGKQMDVSGTTLTSYLLH